MNEQLSVFPSPRLYYNPTSTRTKQPIKRALSRKEQAPQTSTNQVNQVNQGT